MQSLLITGPPASGKSRLALERFLANPDALFIAPSATSAEHLQHQLARAGEAVRPSRITTLGRFLDARTQLAAAPEAVLHACIEDALERLRLPAFAAVASFQGFHRALAMLMEEIPREAISGHFESDLRSVFEHIERNLEQKGMGLRHARLAAAQFNRKALAPQIIFDGFFTFSSAEVSFIRRLAGHSTITVTLPDSSPQREALGLPEHHLATVHRHPREHGFHALTMDAEIAEVARRILDEAAHGRPFREMGVILRAREPYGSALETMLARFGIPSRFYFADPLIDHPAIAFLAQMVRAMLDGWNHETLLRGLRMPASGLGATRDGDRLDFEMRAQLPASGLPVAHLDDPALVLEALMETLVKLDPWRRQRLSPAEWAARFRSLRAMLPAPLLGDRIERTELERFRAASAALDRFDDVIATTALHTGTGETTLAAFWKRCETALALEKFRPRDLRRNVVPVMDVYEARQWELPVVFVCGLVERYFPQYRSEDPLLNDDARRRARLPTSADRRREERFLFEVARTRATEQVILSYAEFDDQGERQIPSFFLDGLEFERCDRVSRPRPRHPVASCAAPKIEDAALRERLAAQHARLAPSSIESYLQCPFQFFASRTLRLRPRPPAPADRMDARLEGSILHRALAERTRMPLLELAVFDEVFQDECRRARVPAGYRTEAVRLELLRNFEAFLNDAAFPLHWPSRVEEEFSFALNSMLTIRGRIDRMDVGPRGEALVIDYKYSGGDKIRERVDENIAGNHVQGGLYLLAAKKHFGLDPFGMLFCGLRGDVVWDGWHAAIPGLEAIGESSTRARLEELMDGAVQKAEEVFSAVVSGRLAPQPADEAKCRWCDFRDACRVESSAAAGAAG